MAKVYNKNNYTSAVEELADIEAEIRSQSGLLAKRMLYDLCTDKIETKLVYLRGRLEILTRV